MREVERGKCFKFAVKYFDRLAVPRSPPQFLGSFMVRGRDDELVYHPEITPINPKMTPKTPIKKPRDPMMTENMASREILGVINLMFECNAYVKSA
jgi:hypothetical protein